MTMFGVNIYLGESEIDKYRNDKDYQKETIEKVKKSMLKAFEENLEENLFFDEKVIEDGLEIEYLAGFADKEKLKECFLGSIGVTHTMVKMLKEADLLDKFTREDLEFVDSYDNGHKGIEAWIEKKKES